MNSYTEKSKLEKTIIAGLLTPNEEPLLFEEDMQELELLCQTAGAEVVGTFVQKRDTPVAATFFGSGKLKEIRSALRQEKCSTLVVDAELSPAQVRNIESIIQKKVIDRSQLILDIFALHASTNEARIQVELAQLRTLYPRLTHAWSHFSKQVGGIGTRGPGEKQLEVDRRLVQKSIAVLRRKLRAIEKSRKTQRQGRRGIFKAALVGYTNVGKSSLLNRLSGANVLVENKLFATLDTCSRRTYLPGAGTVVLTDTVGFLRKLPHHLVASFRSTLEVLLETDLHIIVLDASSAWMDQQLNTVNQVLDEMGGQNISRILVLNKIDKVTELYGKKRLAIAHPEALFVSAVTGEGIEELRSVLGKEVSNNSSTTFSREQLEKKSQSADPNYSDILEYLP